MRRILPLCAIIACALILMACRRTSSAGAILTYNMGEKVQVGPLIYTILDTEWLDQLGDTAGARLPKNRFLSIRLSVTNSGVRPSAIPSLVLLDGKDQEHRELADAQGLADWLGALRMLDPAQTEHGRVLFDVPTGSYRLRVVDDAELDEQRTAMVVIPFQAPPALPKPEIPLAR